jgi:hypothetical protein
MSRGNFSEGGDSNGDGMYFDLLISFLAHSRGARQFRPRVDRDAARRFITQSIPVSAILGMPPFL